MRACLAAMVLMSCSAQSPSVTEGELRVVGQIEARELPRRLLRQYRSQMKAPEPPAGRYYRIGTLSSSLLIFETRDGLVYVDSGGGGKAWSESCRALSQYVRRNLWHDSTFCLDGQLDSIP